jgi:hypothetical protein
MSIFNLFRKQNPEDIYELFTKDIVTSSLLYRKEIETTNNQYSVDAGAEIAYFLLHMFDKQLFKDVGPEARDKIFDKVAIKVLGDYVIAVLKPETPIEILHRLGKSMFDTLNERQRIYSNCRCLMVKGNPGAAQGSIMFALSFYIHKALRKTNRDNVDEIICGKRDIVISELNDFPSCINTAKVCIYAMNTLIESVKMWKEFNKSFR